MGRVIGRHASLSDVHAASGRSFLSHAAVVMGTRLAGRPALLRIHGGNFDHAFEQSSDAGKALIRLILRSASCVVVLGETWRDRVEAIEPRAYVEVIPNTVDCAAYEAMSCARNREARNILFLANFSECKGHFDALEALTRLAPRHPEVKLQLAGEDRDPGTRARLEREAGRLGIADHIEFLGSVSGSEKDEALRDADILILPSHIENMPVSIIEGMAAGLPVVATRVGAVGEMIEDEKNGLLIDPRDPEALAERLHRLLGDRKLREDLGQRARQRACALWDADVVAERNLALYDRLLARRTERAG